MSDPKKDWFERDLSDEEFEALGRELEASPEAAEAFAQDAAKAYQATGLPEPKLPKAGGGVKALAIAGAGLLLAGAAAWAFMPSPCGRMASLPQTGGYQVERAAPQAQAAEPAPEPAMEAQVEGDRALKVVVRTWTDSQTRLRVLGLDGTVVSTLHEGPLPRGRHAFVWNGEGPKGRCPAGRYRLDLRCDGKAQSKIVQVMMR